MKFEIDLKKLNHGEHYCKKCKGYGWIQKNYRDRKTIEKCFDCNNGILFECPNCGKLLQYEYSCCQDKNCITQRKISEEQKRFDKAKTKVDFKEVPSESSQCFYSSVFPYDEGFFENIDTLIDYCNSTNTDIPKYVWGTIIEKFIVPSADELLVQMLEDNDFLLENKEHIPVEAKDKLEKALEFIRKNNGLNDSYSVDFNMCILL